MVWRKKAKCQLAWNTVRVSFLSCVREHVFICSYLVQRSRLCVNKSYKRLLCYHVVYVRVLPAPASVTQLAICVSSGLSESELRCRPSHRCETWPQVSKGIVLTIREKIR